VEALKMRLRELALATGAGKVGFGTVERMADGPPTADARYVLPSAQSFISLARPLDREAIRRYLAKEDQMGHARDMVDAYRDLKRIGMALVAMLKEAGYEAISLRGNVWYRDGGQSWKLEPDLSHRFCAVGAGIGLIGWSGNVVTPEYGSAVTLGTVVTDAPLAADPMLEKNPCDECKVCTTVCPVGMISRDKAEEHLLAGRVHRFGRKGSYARCYLSCAGLHGGSSDGRWSTWSPWRTDIPQTDENIEQFADRLVAEREAQGITVFSLRDHRSPFTPTCGNCQLVCWEHKRDRTKNAKLLFSSGIVVHGADAQPAVVRPSSRLK
jgi:epoxyqueuosine reductase